MTLPIQISDRRTKSSRRVPLLVGMLTTAVIALVVWIVHREETSRYQAETRGKVLAHLSTTRARVESKINSLMYLTRGLKAHISLRPDITQQEFDDIARMLMEESKAIRSVQLAHDSVISHVYPVQGNEAARGLKLLEQPIEKEAVQRAIQLRQSLLAGPIKLVQGGTAFVSHTAIFQTPAGKPPQSGPYWGIVILLIDQDTLLESFQISELGSEFEVAIRGSDALGSQGEVFYGNAAVFERDSTRMDVTLPTGSWQLGALPVGGWPTTAPISAWLLWAGGALALIAGWLSYRMVYMNLENKRLLLAILPSAIANRMKKGEMTIADGYAETTVIFADIVGFTGLGGEMSSAKLVNLLNDIFCEFDFLAETAGVEKIKTIGDAYMAAAGVPAPHSNHAEAIADMAVQMLQVIERINQRHGLQLAVRIGLASGHITAGVIGTHKFIYDLWGDTVNLASRMESSGVPQRIQVSDETYQRLKDKYTFESRGPVHIKGKGKLETFLLIGRR